MAEVHPRQAIAHHALLATVVALIVALLLGAGAVILYYEVADSDVVLKTPLTAEPEVYVVTPEQVATARAIDKHEAERAVGAAVAFGGNGRTDTTAATSSLAGVAARTESMGRIPVDKK